MSPSPHQPGLRLTRDQRLRGRRRFDAVFNARCRKNAGPLALLGMPNDLGYTRIGLVVPRRVGKAVTRNRIKRLLREAYRLNQHELPAGYDLVVLVRPHQPLKLNDYEQRLDKAVRAIDREWQRRRRRRGDDDARPQ